ncbi:Dbl homology domain-containing protein [Nemania sp. FL0916]|nr:Dbl homology domain-containing protein [Nemania sp. FL0916]
MPLTALASDPTHWFSRSSSLGVAKGKAWVKPPTSSATVKLDRTSPHLGLDCFDLLRDEGEDIWRALDNIAVLRLSLENDGEALRNSTDLPRISVRQEDSRTSEGTGKLEEPETPQTPEEPLISTAKPFQKWMKNLHRRAQRPSTPNSLIEQYPEFAFTEDSSRINGHRKSSSGSSFGFVAAVKSATVSLASASIRTRPRRHAARSSIHTRTELSSRGSISAQRISEDSMCFERNSHPDPAVTERLLQRRRILEELITTEESYIGDIRFLMHVYVTILASLPTVQHGLRSSINRNLTDIIELHEEILGELHRIVPDSEYTQPERIAVNPSLLPSQGHHRWHSLDSVPEDKGGQSWLHDIPSVVAEPSIAAEVAQIFGEKMNRFLIYEEYGARYELMIKDIASAHRTLPHWENHQKGLEALAASLSATNNYLGHSRKSLTIGDLLVKPIQRICRYPLLFSELLKYTPVCDCPISHMEIEGVLIRLRETTAEINRATDDPGIKASLEQTWLLQDRLVFPDQRSCATSKSTVRSFGQIRLCGALHVCWQTREGVSGQYMVSLLYRDCLCLATVGRVDQIYTIQACIGLDSIKVEEVDNGRGLQCHTAPFSWKLVFECDHQLYEMIMTACSQKEEMEWRARLSNTKQFESPEESDPIFYGSNYLNIKSLGTVFSRPGSVARRLSIHRATTIGPKSALCQVILKNTSIAKDTVPTNVPSAINRSQSLLTTNSRIPVLAPPRAERVRLEILLADVWSRKTLPYPGIASRPKSDHRVRSSATTMMRKLSAASLTKPFAKRSTSSSCILHPEDNEQMPHVNKFLDSLVSVNCDTLTSSKTETEIIEENSIQRLPIILDEAERSTSDVGSSSSSSSVSQGDDGTKSDGTVRRVDMLEMEAIWSNEKEMSRPPLPTSSRESNNPLKMPPSIKSSPRPCSVEAGKLYHDPRCVDSTKSSIGAPRSSSRWARVGAINRGLQALGGRSFFH